VLAGAIAFVAAGAFMLAGPAKGRDLATPTLHFKVFIQTTQKLDSLVWTSKQFLFVENTANTVWAAPPAGQPLQQFATMPRLVEETRCVLSPGTRGWPPGAIFCHSPNDKIYEISSDGASVTVFARLPAPYPPRSDGALAFDRIGHFGYKLVAATGTARSAGGLVFTIGPHGVVQKVGKYPGPGGADELVIAPGRFRSLAGDALLTLDNGTDGGAVVAVTPTGQARRIATFPLGVNPIALIPKVWRQGTTHQPFPGLYVSDDITAYTYMAPAAALTRYAGDVIVGTESPRPLFWILEPTGTGVTKIPLKNDLPAGKYSLEQAIFVP